MIKSVLKFGLIISSIFSICVICELIFRNSLLNEFAFDDHLAIVNNKDTNPETPYREILRHDIWGKGLREFDSHRSFRPFLIFIFRQLRIMYGLQPTPIRIASISCHLLSTFLVYVLSSEVLGSVLLGFGTALLFVAHPVHVESVVAVVNLAEPLGCAFYCCGFLAYWYSTRSLISRLQSKWHLWNVLMILLGTLLATTIWTVCMFFSVLTKETGVTLAGVVVGTAVASLLECMGRRIAKSNRNPGWLNFLRESTCLCFDLGWLRTWVAVQWVWILAAVLSVAGYTFFRMVTASYDLVPLVDTLLSTSLKDINTSEVLTWVRTLLDSHQGGVGGDLYLGKSELIRKAENPFAFLVGNERALSLAYLHFRYFFVLLWPQQLSAEYAFDCIPKVSSTSDPRNVLTAMLYLGLIVAILVGIVCTLFPKSASFEADSEDEDGPILSSTPSAGRTMLNPSALLISLIWLVVPFIPASGVFLRLGTLLAERLLYIPSIGYCMLLSILVFKLVSFVIPYSKEAPKLEVDANQAAASNDSSRVVRHSRKNDRDRTSQAEGRDVAETKPSTSQSSRILVVQVVYLVLVSVIVYFYSLKTISRNPAWKNDNTLFLDSMNVCPRSAKLHLQVAKIRLNENNPKLARKLVNKALEIDPDFCDIGYQDAILKIVYENDLEGGLKAAAKNLRCIYTNMQSLELLQKIWSQQVSGSPNNAHLLENIGELLVSGGLYLPGGKKLQEAVVMAFEQKNYALALRVSSKAEKMIPEMLNETRNLDLVMFELMRELQCYIYFLGGSTRSFLQLEAGKDKFRLGKSDKVEVARGRSLLEAVLQPQCVVLTEAGPLQYSSLALDSLLQLLKVDFHTRRIAKDDSISSAKDIAAEEDIALLFNNATMMFSSYIDMINLGKDGKHRHYLSELSKQLKESKKKAVKWWEQAGQSYFAANKFQDAVRCFESAMKWGVKGEVDDKGNVQKTAACPCSVKYWYAHSLAGLEGFSSDSGALTAAIDALRFVSARCSKDSSAPKEMRDLASSQFVKLQETLASLVVTATVDPI